MLTKLLDENILRKFSNIAQNKKINDQLMGVRKHAIKSTC